MRFYIRLAREKFSGSDTPISVEVDAPSLAVAEARLGAALSRLVEDGGPMPAQDMFPLAMVEWDKLREVAYARAREIVKLEAEKAEVAEAWKKDRLELIRVQDCNASLTEQIRLARADRDAVVTHAAKVDTERDHYRAQAVGFGEDLHKTRTELEALRAAIDALIERSK